LQECVRNTMSNTMTKYKELPINDSLGVEQFKVGDRVCGYQSQKHAGIVESILEDSIRIRSDHKVDLYFNHWKQCRKLVEVKPREIYICSKCSFTSQLADIWCLKHQTMIKMREVTDE